ncbi:MAG: hypothetical protein IPK99_12520 [Flavobacteriales bacterium]|nr:hypothetical protein [Flavobacteriales bacterium]
MDCIEPGETVDGWNIEYQLPAGDMHLWPSLGTPNTEVLGLEIIVDKYLYLNLGDLTSEEHPITLTLADGTVYSTGPVQNALPLTPVFTVNGQIVPGFCRELDCPNLAEEHNGWVDNMKLLLRFDDFPSAAWLGTNYLPGYRSISRLANARLKIPLRMHCPGDASDVDCLCAYAPGCDESPADAEAVPLPEPRTAKPVHRPIPVAAIRAAAQHHPLAWVRNVSIHCPGCTRIGLHNNGYIIERGNYGSLVAPGTPRISAVTYEEHNRDYVLDNGAPFRRDLAMAGDKLWSELQTSIVSLVPDYGPYIDDPTVPAVQLKHMYFTTAFDRGAPEGSGATNLPLSEPAPHRRVPEIDDARNHIVRVGDRLVVPGEEDPIEIIDINTDQGTSYVTLASSITLVPGSLNAWLYWGLFTPVATPLQAELEFLEPVPDNDPLSLHHITIDLTRPELLPGGSHQILYRDEGDDLWKFDLSPATLIELLELDPSPLTVDGQGLDYLDDAFDFTHPHYNGLLLNIRVLWQAATSA